jgi:hypothetical protein
MHYRVLNAALISRAILETAAATVYLQEKLEATMTTSSDDALRAGLEELHRAIGGGRFNWFAAKDDTAMLSNLEVYRVGDDPELPLGQRATNVMTMVRKLDQTVHKRFKVATSESILVIKGGVIRAMYAMLSDICHPAAGTAILLSSPSDRDGWIQMKATTGERETRWFFWNLGLIVPPVADGAYEALARMNTLVPNS